MTYSRQIRELEDLIKELGKDFRIFEFMDTWKIKYEGSMGMKRSEELRDAITLSDIYEQFKNKSGIFYDAYKITDAFRSFVNKITERYYEPIRRDIVYKDSYDKFHEEWNKLHPDIPYEKYEKAEDEKEGRRLSELMSIYVEPYYKIRNIFA